MAGKTSRPGRAPKAASAKPAAGRREALARSAAAPTVEQVQAVADAAEQLAEALARHGSPELWGVPKLTEGEVSIGVGRLHLTLKALPPALTLQPHGWPALSVGTDISSLFDHLKTVQGWLAGQHRPPPGNMAELAGPLRNRAESLGKAAASCPPVAAVQEKPADAAAARPALSSPQVIRKGVALRNAKFLEWYEARGTDTYHSPKRIQEKWFAMTAEERAAICPDSPGKVSYAAVEQGIKRARKSRDGETTQRKARRKRTPAKA